MLGLFVSIANFRSDCSQSTPRAHLTGSAKYSTSFLSFVKSGNIEVHDSRNKHAFVFKVISAPDQIDSYTN